MPKIVVRVGGDSLTRRIGAALQSAEWQVVTLVASGDPIAGDVLVACPEVLRASGLCQSPLSNGQAASMKIVAVLEGDDDAGLRELVACGVNALVERDDCAQYLKQAVRAALSGAYWISPVFASRLINVREEAGGVRRDLAVPYAVYLTPREEDILALVATGLSNEEIATREHITVRGVKFHVTNLLRKFGCKHRAQLVAVAYGIAPESHPEKDPVPGSSSDWTVA